MCKNFTQKVILIAIAFLSAASMSYAQTTINAYELVYSSVIKGGTTMIGNTSMSARRSNGNPSLMKMNEISDPNNGVGGIGYTQYGNDESDMQFEDVDGVASTSNSSSADLVLPAGTNNIKYARLYWGGRIDKSAITAVPDILRKVKIRFGTGNYSPISVPAANVDIFQITNDESNYQTFADITAYVQSSGSGTYTIADIPATPGTVSGGGKYAGWSIVIAYENANEPLNTIRVYHGFYQIFAGGDNTALTVTLNDLNVPGNVLAAGDAKISVMGWEGDGNLGGSTANQQGDFLKVNGTRVANTVNSGSNFWNGSISKNGAYVTNKNPNYANQMGIDIDEVFVGTGYGIVPNATTATVTFGTEADQYFPSAFAFQIRVKNPLISITKTVADQSGDGILDANEVLTYTLAGTNTGAGQANNAFVVDSLPLNVTYVLGSLKVVSGVGMTTGPKTDAIDGDNAFKGVNPNNSRGYVKFYIGTGSSGATGGILNTNEGYNLQFKVKGQAIPGSVVNTATVYGTSDGGAQFTAVSTVAISPAGGPLPVTLISFTAAINSDKTLAAVQWKTDNETGNKSFTLERSINGVNFNPITTINGNGTTTAQHSYTYNDNISSLNNGVIYYRLRITSIDGKNSYSQIVALKLDGVLSVTTMSVYPNPFVDNVKVTVTSKEKVNTNFSILTMDGKKVSSEDVMIEKGGNIIVLQRLGNLPNGNYLLQVSTGAEKYAMKLVK